MSSRNIPVKPKFFTICAATLNYKDLQTSIQYSLTKKIAIFKKALTLFTYYSLKCSTYSFHSNYIIYSWPSVILDYAVSEDGCYQIWQFLCNVYDLLGVQTHRNDSSSERGQKGLRQSGQTGGLKCPHKTVVRKKKMGEEGRIRKQKVAVMQLNQKKKKKKE